MITNNDIQALREKTDTVSQKLSNLDGFLRGSLPHLATKTDLEEKINGAFERHVETKHGPTITKKQWAAFIGALTVLAGALSALASKLIEVI